MTVEEFKEQMQDILNSDEDIDMDAKLEDIEDWNSLSYVAFLAMAADFTEKSIRASAVRSAKTVSDLYKLIAE